MARGHIYKRCPCGVTGTPGKPACREKHGTWWFRAEAGRDPVTNARIQPARGGFSTRAEAQGELTDFLARLATGTVTDDRGLTVAAWLERWLSEGRWEPVTRRNYETDIRAHLVPLIGGVRLRDLRRRHVESMLAELGRDDPHRPKLHKNGGRTVAQRSPKTLDHVRRTLRAALGVAVRRELLTTNPAQGIMDAIPRRGTGSEREVWTPQQLCTFFEHVSGDPLEALWVVAGLAGLRRAELCGLRWQDLDLTGPEPGLSIRQRVVELPGVHPCPACKGEHRGRLIRAHAKSAAGVRWVPLSPRSVEALLVHQLAQDVHRQEMTTLFTQHDLVFCGEDGAPLRPDSVTKRHAWLVAEAGLPTVVLHAMRHGAVTNWSAAGLSADHIALLAGHTSAAVTREIYLHGVRSQLSSAADAAERMVNGGNERKS
jgi:integrase